MGRIALGVALAALLCLALALPASASAAQSPLLAPASACPAQTNPGAPLAKQARAMRCLVNFARERRGLDPLAGLPKLDRVARGKAADILRCDQFSHEACGREFSHWFERLGYRGPCTSLGENIAWGTGSLGSARNIFAAWLRSAGHRANILGPFAELGIGLRVGELQGSDGAHVWVQAFGSRNC